LLVDGAQSCERDNVVHVRVMHASLSRKAAFFFAL
jgi:hypothetical protein